jgi:hypothetical protein
MIRNRRRLPYQPLPRDLRKRVRPTWVSPVYEVYDTKTGILGKQASFKVEYKETGIMAYRLHRAMFSKMKRGFVPLVGKGHVFKSFRELLFDTPWMRVRRVRSYRKGKSHAK